MLYWEPKSASHKLINSCVFIWILCVMAGSSGHPVPRLQVRVGPDGRRVLAHGIRAQARGRQSRLARRPSPGRRALGAHHHLRGAGTHDQGLRQWPRQARAQARRRPRDP